MNGRNGWLLPIPKWNDALSGNDNLSNSLDKALCRLIITASSVPLLAEEENVVCEYLDLCAQEKLLAFPETTLQSMLSNEESFIQAHWKRGIVDLNPRIAVCLTLISSRPLGDANDLVVNLLPSPIISLRNMELVQELCMRGSVNLETLLYFLYRCFDHCAADGDQQAQGHNVGMVCMFIRALLSNLPVTITLLEGIVFDVEDFCLRFSRFRSASELYSRMRQISGSANA